MLRVILRIVGVLALGLVVVSLVVPWDARSRHAGRSGGFRDEAAAAGLHFQMVPLPGEQGEAAKVNLYLHGAGVVVGDYDGDGFDDVYFLNQFGKNGLYRNNGDGAFDDVTDAAGVGVGDRVCVAGTFADYDNDGDQDLFVTSTRGGNLLFQNLGNGTFQDVTRQAGVALVAHSQAAVFFDYDHDGFLDLFVTNTARWTDDQPASGGVRYYAGPADLRTLAGRPVEHNVLYRNNRDGTFTDVTRQAGLEGPGWGGDVAAFDYDEDARIDLLVTNLFGTSALYRNRGDGTFAGVTPATLKRTSWGATGCKAFDHDNDGKLDLFLADLHSDLWVPPRVDPLVLAFVGQTYAAKYPTATGPGGRDGADARAREDDFARRFQIPYDRVLFGNTFFRYHGGSRFEELSAPARLETFWPWGVAAGDFDNDGYEDLFLPSGLGYPWFYWPNALLLNQGNGTFENRAETAGVEPPAQGGYQTRSIRGQRIARSSRAAAVADFDHDGRLEVVTNNFDDAPYLFRNHFPQRNYVAFRLRGTRSNRDAVGALVTLHAGKEIMARQVHAAGGHLAQSSKDVHFGLGQRARIDRVEIRWPSGARQILESPESNRRHDVVEPAT